MAGTRHRLGGPCLNCICCSSIMRGNTANHPTKGQTIRPVKVRIKEHKNNVRNFKTDTATDTPVSRHFYTQGHHLSQLRWLVLENIVHVKRGGDMKTFLGQWETYWIKRMNASGSGYNDYWSLSPFL
ncbi:hypothetical protein XELAEV_18006971mg [Xenopus laevis]|uniref:Uncharacterized protein n=1 Tax=Xenopus laevis TaxID=8355 RepID=A0A974DZM1_XENLA|nr:hypothetical protein XELAEV_18006971mg [Xenopus laevis]